MKTFLEWMEDDAPQVWLEKVREKTLSGVNSTKAQYALEKQLKKVNTLALIATKLPFENFKISANLIAEELDMARDQISSAFYSKRDPEDIMKYYKGWESGDIEQYLKKLEDLSYLLGDGLKEDLEIE
jgi:hypothetical protein